jgi:hypothetical protein
VALWHCGIVALWHCGITALRHCGNSAFVRRAATMSDARMFKWFGSKNLRNEMFIFREEFNGLVEVAQEERF